MKQIVDQLNKIAKKIDENVDIPNTDLITDSLDAITTALGGTPNDSNLIVDKLEDIAGVATGGGGVSYNKLSVHFVNNSGLAVPSSYFSSLLIKDNKLYLSPKFISIGDEGLDLDFLYEAVEIENVFSLDASITLNVTGSR